VSDTSQAFFQLEAPTHSKYCAWRSVVDAALSVEGLPQKDPGTAMMRALDNLVHVGTRGVSSHPQRQYCLTGWLHGVIEHCHISPIGAHDIFAAFGATLQTWARLDSVVPLTEVTSDLRASSASAGISKYDPMGWDFERAPESLGKSQPKDAAVTAPYPTLRAATRQQVRQG